MLILTLGSPLAIVTCIVRTPWADATFAVIACLFPPALMLLGTHRRGHGRAIGSAIMGLAVLLLLTLGGLFHWRYQAGDGAWWAGLPVALVIQLLGIFLLPLLLMSTAYTWTFKTHFLDDEKVRRLRRDFPRAKTPEAP